MESKKLTKYLEINNGDLVVQSNTLINSRQDMTANEKKILSIIFSKINPANSHFDEYIFNTLETARTLKISKKNEYKYILEILERLQKRLFWIFAPTEQSKYRFKRIPVVSSTVYYPNEGRWGVTLDSELKPYLLEIKKEFTAIPLDVLVDFNSFHEIRILEMVCKNQKLGVFWFELDELRDKAGVNIYDLKGKISYRKYETYRDFKKYVLLKLQERLNEKNNDIFLYELGFEIKEKKVGRKVTHVGFEIKRRKKFEKHFRPKPKQIDEIQNITEPEAAPAPPAVEALTKHGLGDGLARKFAEEQDEAEILRCVARYESRLQAGKVTDTGGGYLVQMLKERAGRPTEADRQAEQKAAQIEQEAREAAEKREAERQAEAAKQAREKAIDDFLAGCDDAKMAEILAAFEQSDIFAEKIGNSLFAKNHYQNVGVKDPIAKSIFRQFVFEKLIN